MPPKITICRSEHKHPTQYYCWRMQGDNEQQIAVSGSATLTKDEVLLSVKNLQQEVKGDCLICERKSEHDSNQCTRFVWFQNPEDQQFCWQLWSKDNDKIIAIGHKGYPTKDDVIKTCENVRREIHNVGDPVWENPEDNPDPGLDPQDENPDTTIEPGS